jgi:hypothetical protein
LLAQVVHPVAGVLDGISEFERDAPRLLLAKGVLFPAEINEWVSQLVNDRIFYSQVNRVHPGRMRFIAIGIRTRGIGAGNLLVAERERTKSPMKLMPIPDFFTRRFRTSRRD